MKRIYIASPFFCTWDNIVRKKMIKAIKKAYPNCRLFLPNRTVWSKLYSIFHTSKLAELVYKADTVNLFTSDCVVFPEYTSDLGTLFEVGCAIGKHVKLVRYNYFTDEIVPCIQQDKRSRILNDYYTVCSNFVKGDYLVLDCSKPINAITCGVLVSSDILDFKYSLPPSWADNIMFKYSGIRRHIEDGIEYNTEVL